MLTIVDDGQWERGEGDRLPQVVLEPRLALGGTVKTWLPVGGGIAVEGGRGGVSQRTREPAAREGDDLDTAGRGPAEQLVDLVVGDERRDGGVPGEREGPLCRHREDAIDGDLWVRACRIRARAPPRHQVAEPVGARRRSELGRQVGRHRDGLGDGVARDLDLGEPDR